MKRENRISAVLFLKLETLKESIGHQKFTDLMAETTAEINNLFAPKEEIIHVIGPQGKHRLIVDGVSSEWMNQNDIAKVGDIIATTDYYINQLPQVGRVRELTLGEFMTTSAQNLSMVPVRFEKPNL